MASVPFADFKLTNLFYTTHDTKRLTYELVPQGQFSKIEQYQVASCVQFKTPKGDVIRPYTPLSQNGNCLDFIFKVYPNGQMSQYVANSKVGDHMLIFGPIPKIHYGANKWKKIGMICGGTGITPMWQILLEIMKNPEDKTEVTLLYGSKTEDDIILRKEIEDMMQEHHNIKVHFVLSQADKPWNGLSGLIDRNMIVKYLPAPGEKNTMIMLCGPDPMIIGLAGPKGPNYTQGPLGGVLKDLGYDEEHVFKF